MSKGQQSLIMLKLILWNVEEVRLLELGSILRLDGTTFPNEKCLILIIEFFFFSGKNGAD